VRLACTLFRALEVINVPVSNSKLVVGDGEIRVDLDRTLIERDSGTTPFRHSRFQTHAVGAKCVERRRGGFLQWDGVLVYRAQRLSQLISQLLCGLVHGGENTRLVSRVL